MINRGDLEVSVSVSIFASLVCLFSLSTFVLSSSHSHADTTSSVTASVTVDAACTMSAGGNTYTHTFTSAGGTTTLTGDTIAISCNDSAGFDVYAIGHSGDMYYTNNTDLIFSGNNADYNIKTDGTNGASYWKMKIETSGSSNIVTIDNNYDDYTNIPSTYTKIAHFNSNISSGYSSIVPTYQVYVSGTQPKGSYTGKVEYRMVHPNNTTAPEPPAQLPEPSASCNTKVPNITYMQDITNDNISTVLSSLTEGAKYYLYDKRDNTPYCVSKLKDGNLWMTENLALDLAALTQTELYGTGSDAGKMTNASNTTLGYLKGTTTGTTSDKYATVAVTKAWTSSSYSYSAPMIAVDSATSGLCNNAYCVNSDLTWSYDQTLGATINGATSRVQGKIGIYYNICAASAGSYCYGNDTSYGTSSGNATEDICPYGWRLPTGGSSGEFQALYTTYSSNYNNFVDALSTPLSGVFRYGKAYYQGSYGYFWSSTRSNSPNMYYLYMGSSSVNPQNGGNRYNGYSVRCLRTS